MNEKEYLVVENTPGCHVICHGSGLSWAEAHLMVMSQMYNDSLTTESGLLQNVDMMVQKQLIIF